MKTKMSLLQFATVSALALTLGLTGCGTIKFRERDAAQVEKVKKVAVVSFSVTQPASAKIGIDLTSGKAGAAAGGSMIPQNSPHADEMYLDFNQSVSKNLGWKVMDARVMKANPGYKAAYDKTMKGWQNKMGPNKGDKQFDVADVMDQDCLRILDVKGRDALIDALGVDAIIGGRVQVILNGTTVMGVGSRYPQSKVAFFVYAKGQEKAIWWDGGVEGEEAKESVGKTGFIDEALLSQLALKSAKTAFAKIGTETSKQ
jgi:hypothetical protein